ncbi:Rossmann fold domain-containing protein [Erythrobacter sp. W53]|uniref:Rossmann fold domain-containing protein n=1 Tax=Erythrobacteraceae TaxID=335929 RepID=UPI0036D42E9F
MKRIAIDDLPAKPLAASGVFHQHWLPHAESALGAGEDVTLIFAPADHTHSAWRRAAIQGLARQYAPRRINGVSGTGEVADKTVAYLADAPGVTGQYLEAE